MANTRLINPIHNLTQTAYDIAHFLRHVSPDKYAELLKDASETYGYSYVYFWRNRVLELNAALDEVKTKNTTEQALTWFYDFIKKEAGGWEENSANVILLRRVLKELNHYDPTLSLEALRELKGLLLIAISERITAEEKVQAEKEKLEAIVKQREALEQEILSRHDELITMKNRLDEEAKQHAMAIQANITIKNDIASLQQARRTQVIVIDALREQIDYKQKQADKQNQLLSEMEIECAKKLQELRDKERTLLSPAEWQAKRINPQDLLEAKKIAETAVNIYIQEKQEEVKKRAELNNLPKTTLDVKATATTQAMNLSAEVAKRYNEAQVLCGKRSKLRDGKVKALLEANFMKKFAQSTTHVPSPTKSEPVVETALKEKIICKEFAEKRANLDRLFKPMLPPQAPARSALAIAKTRQ